MFKIKEIVKPSGRGRTSSWEKDLRGTVTEVLETTVRVQWHDSAVGDEMECCELVSTSECAGKVAQIYRELITDENDSGAGDLLTIENT